MFNGSDIGYVTFVRNATAGLSTPLVVMIVIVFLILLCLVVLVIVMKRQKVGFFKPKHLGSSVPYTAGYQVGMDSPDANGINTYLLTHGNGMYIWLMELIPISHMKMVYIPG